MRTSKYREKHPEWCTEDLEFICVLKDELDYFHRLYLKFHNKHLCEEIINNLERELDESIKNHKHNYAEAPKVSFTKAVERFGETWGRARATPPFSAKSE